MIFLFLGAEKLKDRINPESEPRQIDPRLKQGLSAARWVSSHTVKASGYLVSKAGSASLALGRFLGNYSLFFNATYALGRLRSRNR